MATSLMNSSHESNERWALRAGQAVRLQRTAAPRWLRVTEGRLWVTGAGEGEPAEDCWLQAGDTLALLPGDEPVVEPWPSARFEVLDAEPGAALTPSLHRPQAASSRPGAWRAWAQSLQLTPTRGALAAA
jgi:hypothetical protein